MMKYIEVKDSGNISTQAVITYFFEQKKCFGFIGNAETTIFKKQQKSLVCMGGF
jgi:hypothetical protein